MNPFARGRVSCLLLLHIRQVALFVIMTHNLTVCDVCFNFWPRKCISRSKTGFMPFDIANINLCKSRTWAFSLALTVFQILYVYLWFLKFCYLENTGHGHDVQRSQNGAIRRLVSTSMKVVHGHFSLAFIVFQILNKWFSEILWSWIYKLRSWWTTFSLTPFDGKYPTFYLMAILTFTLSLANCEIFAKIIKFQKIWPWKWRSRSRSKRTGLVPFDWKCSNP